jgi:vacuolar protein sorting-associated protein 54
LNVNSSTTKSASNTPVLHAVKPVVDTETLHLDQHATTASTTIATSSTSATSAVTAAAVVNDNNVLVVEVEETVLETADETSSSSSDENSPAISNANTPDSSSSSSSLLMPYSKTGKQTLKSIVTTKRFPIVNSVLVLLETIDSYIDMMAQLQALGSDVANRVLEILRTFNSRTSQLVLGAGAMHTAKLKTITSSHLALASQSIGFVMHQIPVLKSVFHAYLPEKHRILLSGFDKALLDYKQHQIEIFAKLSSMMEDLIKHTCKTLINSPWTGYSEQAAADAAAAVALGDEDDSKRMISDQQKKQQKLILQQQHHKTLGNLPDPCVKSAIASTFSIHKTLTDLLIKSDRDDIFNNILHFYSVLFTENISKLDLSMRVIQERVHINISFIVTKLRQLVDKKDACKELNMFLLTNGPAFSVQVNAPTATSTTATSSVSTSASSTTTTANSTTANSSAGTASSATTSTASNLTKSVSSISSSSASTTSSSNSSSTASSGSTSPSPKPATNTSAATSAASAVNSATGSAVNASSATTAKKSSSSATSSSSSSSSTSSSMTSPSAQAKATSITKTIPTTTTSFFGGVSKPTASSSSTSGPKR